MAGWLTNGLDNIVALTGNELFPFDVSATGGASPQSASATSALLATAFDFYRQATSKTMVAGSRYFIGPYTIAGAVGGNDVVIQTQPVTLNGVNVKVGGTGGTDLWIAELHDSTGKLLATSNTAGVTAGTANNWMQLPFYSGAANTPYSVVPGTYYIAIQSNGTTATLACYSAPTYPLNTGSATGVFGTGASLTPPTTYTATLGPLVFLY